MGDELTVKKDDRKYQVKIAVITENYAGHYVYMTPNVYKETFGEDPDYADIVFAVRDEYKDQTESIGQIMESPGADQRYFPGGFNLSNTETSRSRCNITYC